MNAYYNEIEPYAAQWLRNLIAAGLIAEGDVDERSIVDVRPDDLRAYTQCHFFAGIGVWSHALRLAGWSDDRPVWTGSCPCQPFSSAGKQAGTADERHLWPVWFNLIRECRPDTIFGEQVSAAIGHGWLDLVQSDLEGEGYACGAACVPACGVGAPHIRQRLWFVADALGNTKNGGYADRDLGNKTAAERPPLGNGQNQGRGRHDSADDGANGQLADANSERQHGQQIQLLAGRSQQAGFETAGNGGAGRLADPFGFEREREPNLGPTRVFGEDVQPTQRGDGFGDLRAASGQLADTELQQRPGSPSGGHVPGGREQEPAEASRLRSDSRPGPTNGHWGAADWLHCRDGRWRPVEPGTFPLAHGASFKLGSGSAIEGKSRVGMLRAYGNAIVAPVAKEFISAFMECRP